MLCDAHCHFFSSRFLEAVYRQTLAVTGPERVLFGTDSSFFPRGWHKPVFDAQDAGLTTQALPDDARAQILSGNFNRLFP